MSDADRLRLEARARTQGWKLLAWLVGFLAAPATGCLLAWVTPPHWFPGVAAGILWLVGPAVAALAANDAYERRKWLLGAADRGEVEVFEGHLSPLVDVDPVLVKLAKRGAFGDGGRERHEVELLPGTGLVHRVNGLYIDAFLKPDVLETAPPRELSPLIGSPGDTRVLSLTEEEREEIRTRASRLWKTPGRLLFLVCYVSLGVFMWRVGGDEWLSKHGLRFGLFGLLALFVLIEFIGRVRQARSLERDAEQGEVVALFAPEPNEDGSISRLMVLPNSGKVWSLDGQPAEWRSKKL